MGIITLNTAISLAKAAYYGSLQQCMVVIENQTDSLLLDQGYHAGQGYVAELGRLPAVPPRYRHGDDTYFFDEAVPLKNGGAPPAVVMQWKFADKDLWLLVLAWMGVPIVGNNGAYYALKEHQVEPEAFWKSAVSSKGKGRDWFFVGDVMEHCDTGASHGPKPVQGISVRATDATDANPMRLTIQVMD